MLVLARACRKQLNSPAFGNPVGDKSGRTQDPDCLVFGALSPRVVRGDVANLDITSGHGAGDFLIHPDCRVS